MEDVVIVAAARTAVGKFGGTLAKTTATELDPFLMIDEIRADEAADYMGGFPPHPHRGRSCTRKRASARPRWSPPRSRCPR